MKRSIRVLQVNGNERSWVHSFKFEVLYTLATVTFIYSLVAMLWFLKINSNINIYNINKNNNKIRKK